MPTSDALQAARALYERIAPRSDEIERANVVPADLVAELNRAGLLGLTIPREYGGAEAPAREVLEVIETLDDAAKVTHSVAVAVRERSDVDLVADRVVPPWVRAFGPVRGAIAHGAM